jgi:hypothetical protein
VGVSEIVLMVPSAVAVLPFWEAATAAPAHCRTIRQVYFRVVGAVVTVTVPAPGAEPASITQTPTKPEPLAPAYTFLIVQVLLTVPVKVLVMVKPVPVTSLLLPQAAMATIRLLAVGVNDAEVVVSVVLEPM